MSTRPARSEEAAKYFRHFLIVDLTLLCSRIPIVGGLHIDDSGRILLYQLGEIRQIRPSTRRDKHRSYKKQPFTRNSLVHESNLTEYSKYKIRRKNKSAVAIGKRFDATPREIPIASLVIAPYR